MVNLREYIYIYVNINENERQRSRLIATEGGPVVRAPSNMRRPTHVIPLVLLL